MQNINKFSYKMFLCRYPYIEPILYSPGGSEQICCDLILTQNKNYVFTVGGVINKIIVLFKFSRIISDCLFFYWISVGKLPSPH